MLVSLAEAKTWLRVDFEEDDNILEIIIHAAEEYLKKAVGSKLKVGDPQAKVVCLVLISDWYENRELIGQRVNEKVRYSIQSLMLQLQCDGEGE